MSWNGPLLISSATRLQGIFLWDLVIYLIEGLLFLLTGFQMRPLYEKSKEYPLHNILFATALLAVFITLIGLGLGLAPVARWLGIAQAGRAEHVAELEAEIAARREAIGVALQSLEAITDDRELSDEVIRLLRARHETRANQLPDSLDQ